MSAETVSISAAGACPEASPMLNPDAHEGDGAPPRPAYRPRFFAALLGVLLLGGGYGALLLILRRYTLRGLLFCSIFSAALAGGLTAYVQTIADSEVVAFGIEVPAVMQDDLQRLNGQTITANGIEQFLQNLRVGGHPVGSTEYASVEARVSPRIGSGSRIRRCARSWT